MAEGTADQEESLRKYNMRVVERLQKFGILGPKTIAVHCVHLDAFEKDILRETETLVTHQPRSNMNNAVGLPDVTGMLAPRHPCRAGQRRLLELHGRRDEGGLPGAQAQHRRPAYAWAATWCSKWHTPTTRTCAASSSRSRSARSRPARSPISRSGTTSRPRRLSTGNLPWHILFGVDGAVVTHTIASGKVLMKDRQLTMLDEAAIMAARA